jgi:hypothetical protein
VRVTATIEKIIPKYGPTSDAAAVSRMAAMFLAALSTSGILPKTSTTTQMNNAPRKSRINVADTGFNVTPGIRSMPFFANTNPTP